MSFIYREAANVFTCMYLPVSSDASLDCAEGKYRGFGLPCPLLYFCFFLSAVRLNILLYVVKAKIQKLLDCKHSKAA